MMKRPYLSGRSITFVNLNSSQNSQLISVERVNTKCFVRPLILRMVRILIQFFYCSGDPSINVHCLSDGSWLNGGRAVLYVRMLEYSCQRAQKVSQESVFIGSFELDWINTYASNGQRWKNDGRVLEKKCTCTERRWRSHGDCIVTTYLISTYLLH